MDQEKNKQLLHPETVEVDPLEDLDLVASATECTGLIPTPPLTNQEAESYTEIYAIPKPENKKGGLGLQRKEKTL